MNVVMSDQAWTIGGYVVNPTPVESGAFGTVYEAWRRSDGQRVALKLVLATGAPDSAEKLAAERRGAELQQQFGRVHGMVPEVYEFGTHLDRHFYIAMEFVDGGSLAQSIARGPLDPAVAAAHAVSICRFLEKAHQFLTVEGEAGSAIVHADLKPQHILLPRPGEIRVLDFGIAKALARTRQVTTNIWGTVFYASPEQLESGRVNPHVDFWSLGVMLYEMIAGHRPYAHLEHDRARLESAIRTNEPRPPLAARCPAALAAIVNKLLAYQPDRRYPSAAAIREDLDAFLDGGTPAALAEYSTPPTIAIARPAATSETIPPPLPIPTPAPPPPAPGTVPPTDPLPPARASHAATASAAGAPQPARRRRLGRVRRVASVVFLLWVLAVLTFEGAAGVASERFRQRLDTVDGASLAESKDAYDRIQRLALLNIGLHWRVDGPLRARLVALADRTLADYRTEQPSVGLVEWRAARDALRWAEQLSGGDRPLHAKALACDAHVTRIQAQSQPRGSAQRLQLFQSALATFRLAADLDPASVDPYLGISRTLVYGLDDVDGAVAAIEQAEKRGYHATRRERAQLGDGYSRSGERSRRLALQVSGEQRQRELEKARDAFEQCVEMFDPVIGFGNAARNLESCKRRLAVVTRELETIGHDADAADGGADPGGTPKTSETR